MDKFYVYRPLLDLLGKSEGTDKGDGYNETLAYGKMLDGKLTKGAGVNIVLTDKSLAQIDEIQTRMLQDPDNKKWNSSAIGRYQIVRTTRREIEAALPAVYPPNRLFDEGCQDEMACFLLGRRGVDKWLAGRLKEGSFINQLAQEWASIPKTDGVAHYEGQNAGVTLAEVRAALAEVKRRHKEGQPVQKVEVPVPVDRPTVPESVEKEVRSKTNWGALWAAIVSALGGFATWAADADRQLVYVVGGGGLIAVIGVLLGGEWIVRRIRAIKKAVEE